MMQRLAIALALAGLASACTCEAPPDAPEPEAESAPAPSSLPQALGVLAPLTPMVTLSVHASSFEVDNAALIATWPAPDRERAGEPQVRAEIPAAGSQGLLVPALHDAMQRAMDVERARAAGGGTPIAFALRVDGDAPWRRVQEALYSAGQAGWVEPRFVLRAAQGEGEVVLALPLPRYAPVARESEHLRREIASLLDGLEPEARPEPEPAPDEAATRRALLAALGDSPLAEVTGDGAPTAPSEPPLAEPPLAEPPGIAPLAITLTGAHDLELRVRGEPLDAACARTGGEPPTLPARDGAVDVAGLGRCIDTARATEPLAIGMLMLAADPALPFAEVAPVLETLRARAEVSLIAAP